MAALGVPLASGVPTRSVAQGQPSFTADQASLDPAALMRFIEAHIGVIVRLDVKLPLTPVWPITSYHFLRDGQVLALIRKRRWWGHGMMVFVGDGVRQLDHFHLNRSYQIATHRAFRGPGFNQVPDLPLWFTGYHVDPFG